MGAGASVAGTVTLEAALAHTGPLGIAADRVTEAFGGQETMAGARAMELLAAMQTESKRSAAEVGILRIRRGGAVGVGQLTPSSSASWHSSGTYDAETKTGGSNGAGMRFGSEAADPENAGLDKAHAFLEPIKAKFPQFSYSDLWILAAYVGLEVSGGPVIPFTPGRVDYADDAAPNYPGAGRLPAAEKGIMDGCPGAACDDVGVMKGWEALAEYMRKDIFSRMGFDDRELVALLCGGHVYGRCHTDRSGYAGAWVAAPTEFSNEYAADMLEDTWTCVDHDDIWLDDIGAGELRPAPGKKQYVNATARRLEARGGRLPLQLQEGQDAPDGDARLLDEARLPFAQGDERARTGECASSAGGEPDNQMMSRPTWSSPPGPRLPPTSRSTPRTRTSSARTLATPSRSSRSSAAPSPRRAAPSAE